MDMHLLVKTTHLVAMALLLVSFILRGSTLFVGIQDQQPNLKARKAMVGLQHLSLTLIIVTGVFLLAMKNFDVQPWFYAKVILFFVLCSSLIKTYKQDNRILLSQRRAGLLIGTVALAGILALVMIKPVFA
ncbi:SirB2 family protein [Acinetobacter sp. A47]|uniref:SirB2 family protein n=1 Tax=Acinetobacter sp. A47 TaxID=1561217 RepID=UPI0005713501|nr:SirB2 family protein [Acinetobacter sp. A47]